MFKGLLFIFSLIFSGSVYAQLSLREYQENFSAYEKISYYQPSFVIEVMDLRQLSAYKVDMDLFETRLRGYSELLYEKGLNEQIELPQLRNKEFLVHVEFFNFIESSSKNAILKAIASVSLNGGGYSNLNTQFNIGAEEFTSFKFKNIDKPKMEVEIEALIEAFSQKFAKKITERIQEEITAEEHFVFEITTIGSAMHQEDQAESREKAVMDALIRASEKAFGTNISNYSEMIDYGDVTDRILSETGGTVLYHRIEEESVKFTEDGYCGLIVKSIIKKK